MGDRGGQHAHLLWRGRDLVSATIARAFHLGECSHHKLEFKCGAQLPVVPTRCQELLVLLVAGQYRLNRLDGRYFFDGRNYQLQSVT